MHTKIKGIHLTYRIFNNFQPHLKLFFIVMQEDEINAKKKSISVEF